MLGAVRVRGVPDTPENVSQTLDALRLPSKHTCVLVTETDANEGMLETAKDYIAYGPVEQETVATLLREHGTVDGDPLQEHVDALGYDDIDALADALASGDETLRALADRGLALPFRLSPPSNGFKDTRRHYRQSGSLGERDDMDELLRRML